MSLVLFVVPDDVHLLDLAGPAQVFTTATDHGATVFAILWSLAPKEILELAGEILSKGRYVTAQTSGDSDIAPLAVDLAKASEDG